jgi:hypothetical protein
MGSLKNRNFETCAYIGENILKIFSRTSRPEKLKFA